MKKLSRDVALSARPERVPIIRTVERDNGGLQVVVRRVHRRWLGWFGGTGELERSYGLDVLGREVYEACDGKTSVKAMIRSFERTHHVSPAEAETAVATFLKTLMAKGLVAMAVDRGRVAALEKQTRTGASKRPAGTRSSP